MMISGGFSCSNCHRQIDIGEPFIADATYQARSFTQEENVDSQYLQSHGEVLCQRCAIGLLGTAALSKLKGTVFVDKKEVALK